MEAAQPEFDSGGLEQARQFQKFLALGLMGIVALLALVMMVAAFLAFRTASAEEEVPPPGPGAVAQVEPGFEGEDFGEPGAGFEETADFGEPGGGFEEPAAFEDPAGGFEPPPAFEEPTETFEEPSAFGEPATIEEPTESFDETLDFEVPPATPPAEPEVLEEEMGFDEPEPPTRRPAPERPAPRPRTPSRLAAAGALANSRAPHAGAAFRDAILLEDPETLVRNLEAQEGSFTRLPSGARADGILAALVRAEERLAKQGARDVEPIVQWTLGFPGSHHSRAFVLMGKARKALGKTKAAAWAYKKASDLASLGETIPPERTLGAFERSLEAKAATDARARLTHTRLVRAERDYAQRGIAAARSAFEGVVRLFPEGRAPLSHVYAVEARKAQQAGRHDEVFPLAKASLDLDTKNVLAHRALGDAALLVDKNWDKAHYHFRLALKYAGQLY